MSSKKKQKGITKSNALDKRVVKTNLKSINDIDVCLMPFGNRIVDQKQVDILKHKILSHGITRALVVIHTNVFGDGTRYYIKDGQHLYMACQALGIVDQLYVIIDKFEYKSMVEAVTGVASINNDQKTWKLVDYVKAFASTNQLIDYNILQNKFLKYGLSYQFSAMIYGGLSSGSAGYTIRGGKFKIVEESKGDEIAEIMQDVILLLNRQDNTLLRAFISAFYNWYGSVTYKHTKFIKYLKANKYVLMTTDLSLLQFFQGYKA